MRLHTALIAGGAIVLIGATVFWAVTDRQSALMAMSGVFLLLTGALQGAQMPNGDELE